MSPSQQPSHTNGITRTRRPRPRSTIGINPLDLSPLPTRAEDGAPAPREAAVESDLDDAGQRVFAAWAAGTEGILKALFETQHAALQANLSALEASANAQRRIAHEWTQAARQAQAAAIEAFRAAGLQVAPLPAQGEQPQQS